LATLGLVGVAFVVILIAVTLIDPNQYKPLIEETVNKQTGLNLKLADIQWQLFPRLGLEISDVSLTDPALQTDAGQLLTANNMALSLAITPLITGSVAINHIHLSQPKIHHLTFADGSTNWDQLTSQSQSKPPTDATPTEATESNFLQQLRVDSIVLEQSDIELSDLSTNSKTQINDFSLTLNDVALNQAISIEFQSDISHADLLQAKITGQGAVIADSELKKFSMPQMNITMLLNKVDGVKTPQTLTIEVSGTEVNLNENKASISNLSLQLAQLLLTTQIEVASLTHNPIVQADVSLNPLPLREWLNNVLGIELPVMQNEKSLNQFHLTAKVKATPGDPAIQIKVDPLSITLDQSHLKGLISFTPKTQAINANLELDQLKIDDYQPVTSEETEQGESGSADSSSQSPIIPTELLRPLNANVSLSAKKLSYDTTPIEAFLMKINAFNGVINLEALDAKVFGGDVKTKGVLNVQGTEPTIKLEHSTQALQIQQALTPFLSDELIQGLTSATLSLNTKGNQIDQLLNRLSGSSQIELTQGQLKGVNLTEMAHSQLTEWSPLISTFLPENYGQKVPPAFKKDTQIEKLSSNIRFQDGQLVADTLSANLEDSKISGRGKFDIKQLKGNVNLNLQLSESLTNPTLAQLEWPIVCSGGVGQPSGCKLDSQTVRKKIEALAKRELRNKAKAQVTEKLQEELGLPVSDQSAENALKQKLDEEKKRAEEKINEKFKDKLGDFFR